jgi:DNA-binding MarR family transcriptional regulator
MDRLKNLLGAASVAIFDAQSAAMARQAGLKHSASAVVLTLGQHDVTTISELAKIVGITHSAMVRLIDGLERDALVTRQRGQSLREVSISLTDSGRDLFGKLRQAQFKVLGSLLQGLPDGEKLALESALSHILMTLTCNRESANHICRFCNEDVCGQDRCPVERQVMKLEAK